MQFGWETVLVGRMRSEVRGKKWARMRLLSRHKGGYLDLRANVEVCVPGSVKKKMKQKGYQ